MAHEFVFGLVGPACSGQARKLWNEEIKRQGIDGFFDFYRAKTSADLEFRLSEMFLLERRGYVLSPELQEAAISLMDQLDDSAKQRGRVDTVTNERGVLVGSFLGDVPIDRRLLLWKQNVKSENLKPAKRSVH